MCQPWRSNGRSISTCAKKCVSSKISLERNGRQKLGSRVCTLWMVPRKFSLLFTFIRFPNFETFRLACHRIYQFDNIFSYIINYTIPTLNQENELALFTLICVTCCSKLNGVVRWTFELSSTEDTVKRILFSFKQNSSTVIFLQYSQHTTSLKGITSFLHLGHSSFCI